MIDILLLLLAIFAGVLTILAPCVFTLLPVIVGGTASSSYKFKPLVIATSTVGSIVVFTVLLRVLALRFVIPESTWQIISGIVIVLLGIFMFFPTLWDKINVRLGLSSSSERIMHQAATKKGFWADVALGAALGPVFTSCSPTYFLILGVVFVESFALGLIYILAYAFGLGLPLLAIGYFGQKLVDRFRWAANPNGRFKKIVAIIIIVAGFGIMFGVHKDIQTYIVQELPFLNIANFEQELLNPIQESL